jgi:UDP-2,4-diacetamido-2,4,6-trideoxy-beta-L-altropyranose hydrolase
LSSNILYIRTDADARIGTGHVMRCIAFAQAWKDQGDKVTFIGRCESEFLRKRIHVEGFSFVPIENVSPNPSDLELTLLTLQKSNIEHQEWLILDGYHFSPEYQKTIRDKGFHLLVIDDTNHLSYYHTDIILNQNMHAKDLKYRCDADTTLLLGPHYVLLRREFLKYQNLKRQMPDRARNILVTMGGADPKNVTLKVIEALELIQEPDITVRFIIGPANPHEGILRKAIACAQFEAELLVNPPSVPDLMVWADMAVSGAGSTCWELAFMGVPSIVLILAENQASVAEYLMARNAVMNLGFFTECTKERISYACKSLIDENIARTSLSQHGIGLIDGLGSNRVIKSINSKNLTLRDVTDLDCELIWHWANDGETRKVSYSQAYIAWDEHVSWFDSVRRQEDHRFYVADNGNKRPVGQIRFVLDGKDAVVSLSVAPESRRRGYGKEILVKAAKKLFNETDIEQISAYIKSEHIVSLRVFQEARFLLVENVVFCGVKSCKMILRRPSLS